MTAYVDDFYRGYVECALWSSYGDDETPLDDDYTAEDLAPDAVAAIRAECVNFCDANVADLDTIAEDSRGAEHAGHDFWLTRNGHGTGFWDRTYAPGALRDAYMRLSDACKPYGTSDVYVGDDGRLHVS